MIYINNLTLAVTNWDIIANFQPFFFEKNDKYYQFYLLIKYLIKQKYNELELNKKEDKLTD